MDYPFAVHKGISMKKDLSGSETGVSDTASQKT